MNLQPETGLSPIGGRLNPRNSVLLLTIVIALVYAAIGLSTPLVTLYLLMWGAFAITALLSVACFLALRRRGR